MTIAIIGFIVKMKKILYRLKSVSISIIIEMTIFVEIYKLPDAINMLTDRYNVTHLLCCTWIFSAIFDAHLDLDYSNTKYETVLTH